MTDEIAALEQKWLDAQAASKSDPADTALHVAAHEAEQRLADAVREWRVAEVVAGRRPGSLIENPEE